MAQNIQACDKCGKAYPPTARFCPHCGNSLANGSAYHKAHMKSNTNPPNIQACDKCGKDYPSTARFCPHCGNSLANGSAYHKAHMKSNTNPPTVNASKSLYNTNILVAGKTLNSRYRI